MRLLAAEFSSRAWYPVAVFPDPVVLKNMDWNPLAVFSEPVVFRFIDREPVAAF